MPLHDMEHYFTVAKHIRMFHQNTKVISICFRLPATALSPKLSFSLIWLFQFLSCIAMAKKGGRTKKGGQRDNSKSDEIASSHKDGDSSSAKAAVVIHAANVPPRMLVERTFDKAGEGPKG